MKITSFYRGHTKRDISNQLPSRALEGEVVKDIKVVKKSTYKTSGMII